MCDKCVWGHNNKKILNSKITVNANVINNHWEHGYFDTN